MLAGLVCTAAAQQVYPSRPIRFISPFAPGGATSVMARLLGQKLTERWGQPVIVDNRPGGNTIIGTEALVKAPPDGYTILVASNSFVVNALLLRNLPYDAMRDFAPVAAIASGEFVLVLHPSVPASDLQELIALAKSKPGQLNYATSGSGTITHLASELFRVSAGIRMQHVPYKSGAQVVTDLMGAQVQLAIQPLVFAIPHIKAGKLRAIAVTGESRFAGLPQVPTFREAGMAGFDVKTWIGVLAPARTPREIIDKLSGEMGRILALPDIGEKVASQGLDPYFLPPSQFAALLKTDMARFDKVIKMANIKLDD